ncbi:BglG family transcription antiterminator [Alkalicoccobacillus gibsonii]|uniref:BglG family transcription antiterminator n=1 Tax=Alkalicoccobacillus gibsonii TaxID=79881 RepID=UPI003513247F
MFDHKSMQLLMMMVDYPKLSIPELKLQMNLSSRQFAYNLDKLNEGLKQMNLPLIKTDQIRFEVSEEVVDYWKTEELAPSKQQFVFQENERIPLIYLFTYLRNQAIGTIHFQSALQMSRNTALADVKKLREQCRKNGIDLAYNRSKGFHLEGSEWHKRRFASICIGSLLALPMGWIGLKRVLESWNFKDKRTDIRKEIERLSTIYRVEFVGSRLDQLVYELLFLQYRYGRKTLYLPEKQMELIIKQPLYEMGTELSLLLFDHPSETEKVFLTVQLLSVAQGTTHILPEKELREFTQSIILDVERLILVPFLDKETLEETLYKHLVPAYFRIVCGVPLANPLIKTIIEEHGDLFEIVKYVLRQLEQFAQEPISEEEAGYFTILFGGHVRKYSKKVSELKAVIVCPNGISSSLMLRTQLRELFPQIEFTKPLSLQDMKRVPADRYDMVFSTVYLNVNKPVYLTKPLLTQLEKNYLLSAVASDFSFPDKNRLKVDNLMAIVKKHATIKNEKKLFEDITHELLGRQNEERRESPLLSELLTPDKIHFTEKELSWQEAITLSAKPLVEQGYITPEYTEAMIKRVTELGAFIHIGKGIAIPHARPEDGVQKLGMSFLKVRKPVLLLDDEKHSIDLFICLAAIDNTLHLKALSELTSFLVDDKTLKQFKQANTAEDIIKMMKKKGEDEK